MSNIWPANQKPGVGYARLNYSDPLADGLVVGLLFNEGSGDIVYDLSGNRYHGTGLNGPTWGGAALRFDGTDDEVQVQHNVIARLTDQATLTVRTRLDAKGRDQRLLDGGYQGGADDDAAFLLWYDIVNDCWGVRVVRNVANSQWQDDNNSSVATIGAWTTLCVTYNKGVSGFYQDGKLVASDASLSGDISQLGLYGYIVVGDIPAFTGHYTGAVDWVTLHDYALTADDVRDLHDNPYRMFVPEPLWLGLFGGGGAGGGVEVSAAVALATAAGLPATIATGAQVAAALAQATAAGLPVTVAGGAAVSAALAEATAAGVSVEVATGASVAAALAEATAAGLAVTVTTGAGISAATATATAAGLATTIATGAQIAAAIAEAEAAGMPVVITIQGYVSETGLTRARLLDRTQRVILVDATQHARLSNRTQRVNMEVRN